MFLKKKKNLLRLRRQVPPGEAIDENLAAAGSGSGSSERLQLQRKFVRIVGERCDLRLAHQDRRAVGPWFRAYAVQLVLHADHLRTAANHELCVEDRGPRNRKSRFLCDRETLRGDAKLIRSCRKRQERVLAVVIGLCAMLAAGAS